MSLTHVLHIISYSIIWTCLHIHSIFQTIPWSLFAFHQTYCLLNVVTVSVVMTCTWHCQLLSSCVIILSCTYTLTQHIFIITAVQLDIHVQWSSLCHMHMYHITYTIKHDMPHFIYTCTHVLHNINLVMLCVLFILNVSFYPTYTIQKCILITLDLKSQ